jgi:hypothetical protein
MKFVLSKNGKIGYSPAEREVFSVIPVRPDSITTSMIVSKRYGKEVPYHGPAIIRSVLRSLEKKTKHNGEVFEIKKSERAGPHQMSVWLEAK